MIDRILVFLASLMLAILITLGFIEYQQEYDALIGIVALTGFFVAV